MKRKHKKARGEAPVVDETRIDGPSTEAPAETDAPVEPPAPETSVTPEAPGTSDHSATPEAPESSEAAATSGTDSEEQPDDAEETLSLRDHLMALRRVIIVCVASVGAAFLVSYYFVIDPLMKWITAPIEARGVQVIYTAVSEALTTKLKVAAVTAVVIAFPIIIWQVWRFIKPALYPKEQRSFRVFFFFALVLFLIGIVFCYASVFFLAIDFFMVSGEGLATPMLSMDKYVSFLFGFLLPFGIAFMLPVFIYITTRVGLTTPQMLASKRKYVILGIFIVAAILTPPDVVSQIMLGLPMIALYEVGILVSRFIKKKERE